jgi:Asp-tRNA(Asn)/Glu-tRNA(Gln) amidotransferase A subunit family amidase
MGTGRTGGRPRGRWDPIASREAAEQYLARKIRDAKVRATLIELAHRAALNLREQPRAEHYRVSRKVQKLRDHLRSASATVQELSFLTVSAGASWESWEQIPLLTRLEAVADALKEWEHQFRQSRPWQVELDALARFDDRRAFCVRLLSWTRRLKLHQPMAKEMMALSVLVGLEKPTKDQDQRLDAWRHRYNKARRDVGAYDRATLGKTEIQAAPAF